MTNTFSPPVPPDTKMDVKSDPRILETKMGDGYVQRAKDGINTVLLKCGPRWTNLKKTEADYILAFLKGQEGWQSFYWTRPRELTQRLWICKSWQESWKYGNYCDIQADFEEVVL